eukprot:GILI01002044.1.p1 GENE.GILI01002044.1~~GILI01002044.1.p1  ORF type:complete len:119 (-),score=42.48 GILI01002044.1:97-453(-)
MAEQQRNIEALLKAEEEASRIVNNAKAKREKRLKEAQFEADREIGMFRQQQEERFLQETQLRWGGMNDNTRELEDTTQAEIRTVRRDFEANKNSVIDLLMHHVLQVNLSVPEAVKQKF